MDEVRASIVRLDEMEVSKWLESEHLKFGVPHQQCDRQGSGPPAMIMVNFLDAGVIAQIITRCLLIRK